MLRRLKKIRRKIKEMRSQLQFAVKVVSTLLASSEFVAPSATTVFEGIHEAPLAPRALMRILPTWAQVAAIDKREQVKQEKKVAEPSNSGKRRRERLPVELAVKVSSTQGKDEIEYVLAG